jgi:hypothetical protein
MIMPGRIWVAGIAIVKLLNFVGIAGAQDTAPNPLIVAEGTQGIGNRE